MDFEIKEFHVKIDAFTILFFIFTTSFSSNSFSKDRSASGKKEMAE